MKAVLTFVVVLGMALMAAFAYAQQSTGSSAATQSTPSSSETTQLKGQNEHHGHPSDRMHSRMMERCQKAKAEHEKMVAKMEAMNKTLDDKLAVMNSAQGEKRVAAMADVINELVAQRKQLFTDFSEMHKNRMSHMMEHGGHRMMGGPMGQECPMMKDHGEMNSQPQGPSTGRPQTEGATR